MRSKYGMTKRSIRPQSFRQDMERIYCDYIEQRVGEKIHQNDDLYAESEQDVRAIV
jgi:hypothetical protein